MDFSQALIELKAGKRIAREGWNGKGMWLAMSPWCTGDTILNSAGTGVEKGDVAHSRPGQ
jgi:hypothetical protein